MIWTSAQRRAGKVVRVGKGGAVIEGRWRKWEEIERDEEERKRGRGDNHSDTGTEREDRGRRERGEFRDANSTVWRLKEKDKEGKKRQAGRREGRSIREERKRRGKRKKGRNRGKEEKRRG